MYEKRYCDQEKRWINLKEICNYQDKLGMLNFLYEDVRSGLFYYQTLGTDGHVIPLYPFKRKADVPEDVAINYFTDTMDAIAYGYLHLEHEDGDNE